MAAPSVLIVTYGFPPHIQSLGGAIRMLKLAEFLQNSGCQVHVLCARTAYANSFGYDALLASLTVTYVDDPVAQAGARIYRRAEGEEGGTGAAPGAAAALKRRFKRAVIDALTPDTAILTVGRMRRAARAIVAAQPDMTVITSGPPHSVHLVGSWLKQRYPAINWMADYRDSWNGSALFRKKHWLFQKLNEHFEKKVLGACTRFTYVSDPMLGKAAQWGGAALAGKSQLVRNGFDAALLAEFPSKTHAPGPLRLGYFGAIDDGQHSYRDPTCLFEILLRRPDLAVRVELYGSIQVANGWKQKLGDRLYVGPKLSHADALSTMAGMDALLLLHTREEGADEVVTGKVFEYIASGLPIVSIGPAEMAVNVLLRDDPTAFAAAHTDPVRIEELLAQLAASKAAAALPVRARTQLHAYSRESQFANVLHLIQSS